MSSYPHDSIKIFAYDAEDIKFKKENGLSYNKSYFDASSEFKYGFRFKDISSSPFLNYLINQIDEAINFKGVIPNYDKNLKYKKGSVFLYNNYPVQLIKDIDEGRISRNFVDLNKIDGFINKECSYPYWSIGSITEHYYGTSVSNYFIPKESQNIVNAKLVDSKKDFLIKDYTNDSCVDSHKNDDFRIHIYNEKFLTDNNDSIGAFSFNFYKKYIFLNLTDKRFVQITKNFFKCFPNEAKIKVCEKNDDAKGVFREAYDLISDFKNNIYLVDRKIDITQIDHDKFLIENLVGSSALSACEAYLDIKNNKIVRLLDSGGKTLTLQNGNRIEEKENASIVTIERGTSYNALLLIKQSKTPFTYLYMDKITYILFSTDNAKMCVVKYNGITAELSVLSRGMEIESKFVRAGYTLRILKNYGQFEEKKHLIVANEASGIGADEIYNCCYLVVDGDNVMIESINRSDNAVIVILDKYYAHCQFFNKEKQELYLFKVNCTCGTVAISHSFYNGGASETNATLSTTFTIKVGVFDLRTQSFRDIKDATHTYNTGYYLVRDYWSLGLPVTNRFSNRFLSSRMWDVSIDKDNINNIILTFYDLKNFARFSFEKNNLESSRIIRAASVESDWHNSYGTIVPHGVLNYSYNNCGTYYFSGLTFDSTFSHYAYGGYSNMASILTTDKITIYNSGIAVYETSNEKSANSANDVLTLWRE